MSKNLIKGLTAIALTAASIWLIWSGYEFMARRTELAKWSPEQAEMDANRDIKSGSMKIYLHGSFAAYAVGVDNVHRPLIEKLPKADAGVGCVIDDMETFNAQGEYATRYNQVIVQYLLATGTSATQRESRNPGK